MAQTAQNCIERAIGNNNRTFGIEVEFIHDYTVTSRIVELLQEGGVNVYDRGYTHIVDEAWKIVTDQSLVGHGSELVSPILKGIEGLREVKRVLDVLAAIPGVWVNKSCGLHVHHGIPDATPKMIRNLVNLYARSEHLIDEMMPFSRRGNENRYCKSMVNCQVPEDETNNLNDTISYLDRYSRYVKVNLMAYRRYGTVEFRQHGGTVEADKVIPWIIFTQTLVEKAAQCEVNRTAPFSSWTALKDGLKETQNPLWSSAVSYAISARVRHFATGE